MKAILNYFWLFILIIKILHIYSLKFTTHKIHLNENKNLLSKRIRSLLNTNNTNNDNYIPLLVEKEGLYTFDLNIGNPSQQFSLILDTASSFLWINSDNCLGCKSEKRFIPSLSNSFVEKQEIININYISGKIFGNICTDNIEFYFNNSLIPNFSFILVNETNIDYDFEGIFGLSKSILDIQNLEYSTLYQIDIRKILNKNVFLLDFSKNNFYMGEIPSYLNEYNSYSCENLRKNKLDNYYWNCLFEKLEANNNQIVSSDSSNYNNILFNSGTNCLIFPTNYISSFTNIISNNKLLSNCSCLIKLEDEENNIYSLICNNNISSIINGTNKDYKNIFYNKEFISFYLEKNNKIAFMLSDLYNKDEECFKIYFTNTPNNAIILGIPFFEKYPILFDKDNNKIIIYDGIKKKKAQANKTNLYIKIAIIILISLAAIIIIILIYRIIRNKNNNKNVSSQIEQSFSNSRYSQLSPDNSAKN